MTKAVLIRCHKVTQTIATVAVLQILRKAQTRIYQTLVQALSVIKMTLKTSMKTKEKIKNLNRALKIRAQKILSKSS